MNPYQAPTADVSTPFQGGYDQSGPFSPGGRFGRLSYLAWGMVVGIVGWVALLVFGGGAAAMGGGEGLAAMGATMLVVQLVLLVPSIIFLIRRLHDIDATGWWALVIIVPLVNIILMLMLLFKRGTDGANRFAPPRETRGWEKVLGYIAIGFMVLAVIGIIAAIAIPAMMR
jgi:uncharacterized membrane protein YhaH (DUF805 family)